jgi:hypothetical protein
VPHLLHERPAVGQIILVVLVPLAFGVLTGIMLGISEIAYLVLSVLGIAGGFVAGLEHESALEGFYRGVIGGQLFGVGILLAHGIADVEPEAHLPDPEILLVAITALFGMGLGALGGRMRGRRIASASAAR